MVVLGDGFFFFSSRRRHTRLQGDWSSDVCSSDLFMPRGMNGADLSPLFSGRAPRAKRDYRTSAYSTYLSASDGRWLLISDRERDDVRLYDRRRDRYERSNVARRHPKQVRRLWSMILRDAGGRLPRHPD